MGEPVRRRFVRQWTNPETNRVELENVELTEAEVRQRLASGERQRGVAYVPASSENTGLQEAAVQSTEADVARRAADGLGTAETVGFNLYDGMVGGAMSEGMRGRIGDERADRVLQAQRQGSPTASLVSRMLGNVVGAPGIGAFGVGRGVAGALGAGRIAAGGIEGLFAGTLGAAEEAALTGDDFSEHLIANLGFGLLGGIGGEAIFGARNVARSQASEVAAQEAARAGAVRPGFVRRAIEGVQELVSGVSTRRSFRSNRPFREVLDDALPVEQMGEPTFIDNFARDFEEMVAAADDIRLDLDSLARSSQARQALDQMPSGALRRPVGGRLQIVADELDGLLRRSDASSVPRAAQDAVSALRRAIPDDNIEALARLADVRAAVSRGVERTTGQVQAKLQGTLAAVDGLVRQHMPGDLGTQMLRRADAIDGLAQAREGVRRIIDPDAVGARISRAKLSAKMKEAARSGDQATINAIKGYLVAAENADRVAREFGNLGTGKDFLKRQASLAQRFRNYDAYHEVEAMVTRETQKSGLTAAVGGIGGFGAGAGIGFGIGGPAGALVGLGIAGLGATITRPIRTAQMTHRVGTMLGRNQARATRAINQTKANLASTTRIPHVSLPVPKAGIAVALVKGSREQRRNEYDEIVTRLEEFATDPLRMADVIANNLEGVDEIAPGAGMHTAMKMQQGLGVLLGALPPARRRGLFQLSMSSTEIPASQAEVDDFLQVAAVVEDPFFGVDLMNAGRLSPQSANAMRQMYPRIHAELVATVAETIRERRSNGQHVNYQAAIQYSMFAGAPLDDTLEPGFLAAMQDQSAQTQAQEQAQFARPVSTRRPSGFTDNALSSTQQLEQR